MINAVSLPEFGVEVGVLEIAGADPRVAVVSGGQTRHMSAAAAFRLAREYEESPQRDALAPVSGAIKSAADHALLLMAPEGDA